MTRISSRHRIICPDMHQTLTWFGGAWWPCLMRSSSSLSLSLYRPPPFSHLFSHMLGYGCWPTPSKMSSSQPPAARISTPTLPLILLSRRPKIVFWQTLFLLINIHHALMGVPAPQDIAQHRRHCIWTAFGLPKDHRWSGGGPAMSMAAFPFDHGWLECMCTSLGPRTWLSSKQQPNRCSPAEWEPSSDECA